MFLISRMVKQLAIQMRANADVAWQTEVAAMSYLQCARACAVSVNGTSPAQHLLETAI